MPRSRSPLKSLAATLDRSAACVALFDEQRRLVYASAPCGQWLGVSAEDLAGRIATYSSEPQSDVLAAAVARISPPPDAFQGTGSEATLAGATGLRRSRFIPLALGENRWAVLLIVDDQPASEVASAPLSSSSDWHAALAQVRAQLPMSLQSEYLAGDHPLMRRLREQVQVAAKSKARTVIVAPRGGGAADIAATLHVLGGGRNDGLIPLHCPLQDAETLQAAIRAVSRKAARSERGPAILLRDVHLLPATAQQELLGFLQQPGFDVRVLSTSRVSLAAHARKDRFSPELAALLTTLELRVPPLTDRPQDVPLLAQLFLERFNLKSGSPLRGFVPEAIEQLVAYDWPENVDELAKAVTQTCEQSAGPWIITSELSERLRANWQDLAHPRRIAEPINLDAALAETEKELLSQALTQAKGNKSEAARLLGVSRPRFLRRLVQLGLITTQDVIDFEPLDDKPSQEAS
jgi:transcriptional regulator with PAS, ATPase and Fis domain